MVYSRVALALALLVGGCADEAPQTRKQVEDPLMTEALEGQLLVDPDLTQKNMRNAAVVPAGPIDPARPPADAEQGPAR
ncbi:hypothetical protein [Novosphingobium huizhouense]|uniref:hypothetical protein n=1 Tax=Novosphingobium huizhouense TaxID=2866625 RepID=UPI001CD897A5|nr:hypothetical protein [Novosphingobium huizhouense]